MRCDYDLIKPHSSMRHEPGSPRFLKQVLGHAAQYSLAKGTPAVDPCYNEVGIHALGRSQQILADVAVRSLNVQILSRHFMPP